MHGAARDRAALASPDFREIEVGMDDDLPVPVVLADLDVRDEATHAGFRVLCEGGTALQALDPPFESGAVVVDDRDRTFGIDVVAVARHPVDGAVRGPEREPFVVCVLVHEASLAVEEALDRSAIDSHARWRRRS